MDGRRSEDGGRFTGFDGAGAKCTGRDIHWARTHGQPRRQAQFLRDHRQEHASIFLAGFYRGKFIKQIVNLEYFEKFCVISPCGHAQHG